MKYVVGKTLGIIDPMTGTVAHCILVDGDTVLCAFFGSRAKADSEAICNLLNAEEFILPSIEAMQ